MNEFRLPKVFNWQKSSEKIIKKYVATLYQDSTNAPLATELYNDTGITFTYEYIDPGVYAVIASKPIFTGSNAEKTQVSISNATYIDDITGPSGASVTVFSVWFDTMIILTSDLTAETDGILGQNTQNTIEITFYN